MNPRRQFAFNAAAGGAANLIKIGIQLLLLPVMAHLLGPAEFGLYALALPTVSFFTVLADGGLGTSLAREQESSSVVWSTAFWVLLATGMVLALLVSGWGVALSVLAQQPRLAGLMAFLSITFVLLTLSALPSAQLMRRGSLVVYAGGDLVANCVGAIVAVVLAVLGAGAWSLAAQYVTGFAVRAVILNAAAFYRPTGEFKLSLLRPHISTGGSVIGSRLSEFAGRVVENFLFGWMFGTAALGTYTFANQAPRFLCEAAGNPIWGALYSHALREDPKNVAALHARLCRLLASLLFPVAFLLAATAPQIFALVLGPKWAASAPLLRILVPFYALNAVAAQSGAILLANGRNAAMFWTFAGLSVGRVLSVCIGFWAGPIGVAWGLGLSNVLYAAAMFYAPARTTGTGSRIFLRGIVAPAVSGALGGLACFLLLNAGPAGLLWTTYSVAIGGCAYLLVMVGLEGEQLQADFVAIRRIVFRVGTEAS